MNLKVAIKAGVLFAIPMIMILSITEDITKGLFIGIFSGILFAISIYIFANSKIVKKQTAIETDALFPNEKIIDSKAANLIVNPKDFGLNQFAFDELLSLVGMKNKEALGGRLHLTNFRLIFKSHKINRLNGTISIFLPTIKAIDTSSSIISEKMIIETYTSKFSLIINETKKIKKTIFLKKNKLNIEDIKQIKQMAIQYPQKCSSVLTSWDSLNSFNNLLLVGKSNIKAVKLVINPLGALGAIFLKELIEKSKIDEGPQTSEDLKNN